MTNEYAKQGLEEATKEYNAARTAYDTAKTKSGKSIAADNLEFWGNKRAFFDAVINAGDEAASREAAERTLRHAIDYVANEANRQSFCGTLDKLPQAYYDYKAANRTLHQAFFALKTGHESI